ELELDVLKGQAAGEGAEVPGAGLALTDEARAALAGQVTDEMLDQLRVLMKEDIDDLARRLRDVERAMLDERDVERIARQVLADVLTGGDLEKLQEIEGDAVATARFVERRVDELEEAMAAMALEFRGELAQLGVRVDVLEARVDRIEAQVDEQGRRLDDILRRLGSMSLSGKNETTFELTAIDAPGATDKDKFYLDPRDEDSEELKRGSEFKNVFTVTFTAEPAENVNVTASLKATTQLGEVDIKDAEGIK